MKKAKVVEGSTKEQYLFNKDEIKRFIGDDNLTDEQIQEIADVLAANVEVFGDMDGKIIPIEPDYFNDCFYDMEEELIEQFS